jgi:hypothetical protein
VKRDHASLCSYNPKQNTAKTGSPKATGMKRQRSAESEGSMKREESRWPKTNGRPHPNNREGIFYSLIRRRLGVCNHLTLRMWRHFDSPCMIRYPLKSDACVEPSP